jgi:hypothetical protein
MNRFENINANMIIYPKSKWNVWRVVGRIAKLSPMLLAPFEPILLLLLIK